MHARSILVLVSTLVVGLACKGGKTPAVPLRPPVATASATSTNDVVAAAPRPAPVPAVALGTFGEGTFGPRLVRGKKGGLIISAPRSTTGRRWIAYSIDEGDHPSDARHEVGEAPEDSSAWDVKPIGEGYLLAWTRPTDAGPQLLTVPLASDGSPKASPTVVTRSSDELVAVRIHALPDSGGAAALLTYGEKSTQKGGIVATGTLQSFALDALGRSLSPTPTKVAERLSAWQVTIASGGLAVVAYVQRGPEGAKTNNPKDPATSFTGQDEQARAARAVVLTPSNKGLTVSDAVTLSTTDTALAEIDVASTGPGRALVVWCDRRDLDAHVFAAAVEVSSKPKLAATPRRAVPPRGDQTLVGLAATQTGAVVLYETIHPRATHEPRRRFDLVRLSPDGEATATPRGVYFPYDDDEPELVAVRDDKGPTDEVALLTYGSSCTATGDAPPVCEKKELRPMVVRFGGATLVPKQVDLLDVGTVAGGAALHAFDLACTPLRCDALVEGPGNPTTVALAKLATRSTEGKDLRWVFDELVETSSTPPRLESATTLGRESQFAGLHATKAGTGTLVGWVTYFADDAEVEIAAPIEIKKKKKGDKDDKDKPKPKPKAKKKDDKDQGARVAVRLLDATGEPVAPIAVISERALSKGDVAIAWSALDKGGALVAYVSRAEGDEEVYIASVDAKGRKSGKSSRITHASGAASDVAMVALPPPEGGWLLAWVDGRKDVSSVYAVRIDKGGQKVGSEVKIGGGLGGDVSDVSLALVGTGPQGPRVAAVFSDARDDATHGFANVYLTIISGKDPSKALVAEKPLIKTKMHSHNPVIAARSDGGALIAWLEDDPSASEMLELTGKPEWGAYVARIDAAGTVVQSPTIVSIDAALGKGIVSGIAADCVSSTCRLALAWGDREGIALLAANVPAAAAVTARSVWSYHGAPTQEVAPALVGSTAFLCEDGLEKDDGRVRRLAIGW